MHVLRNGTLGTSRFGTLTTNTCAFDSVIQSLAIGYLDKTNIKKKICDKNNEITDLINSLITSTKKTTSKNIYEKRTNILTKIFKIKKGAPEVDCACNVSTIIDSLEFFGFYSSERHVKCQNTYCKNNKTEIRKCSWVPLNLDIIKEKGINSLNEAVDMKDYCRKCIVCNCETHYEYILNDFVFFEFNYQETYNIDDIPKNINILEKKFEILSVIDFGAGGGSLGHYKARCFRKHSQMWQCYDDLNPTMTRNTLTVIPHCMIYTVT